MTTASPKDDLLTKPGPGSGSALVILFAARADQDPAQVAIRHKELGIWREVTWASYRDDVEQLALGMVMLGVVRGDRVAVMGRPTREWLYADLATQSIGGITCGLYLTTPLEELRRQLECSAPRVFVAETMEYVDLLLAAERQAGTQLVEHIVVADSRGMWGERPPRLLTMSEVRAAGEQRLAGEPGAWRRLLEERSDDEPVRLFFTAGAVGTPKATLLTSRSLTGPWGDYFSSLERPPGPNDRSVSAMPLAHVGETAFSLVLPVLFGSVPHFPEGEESVAEAFVEVSPTLLLAFPRVLELYASSALIDLGTGSRLKRAAYRLAVRLRGEATESRGPGRWFAHQLLFRHLLNKFGFRRVRVAMTGGAPVSKAMLQLWKRWGLDLTEFYGLTECGGLASVHRPEQRATSALRSVELRLAPDGEILIRGGGVFGGYVGPADEPAVVDDEGWLHTGDLGSFVDDGTLRILGRKADLLLTTGGDRVLPADAEHALKASPYVRDAILTGEAQGGFGAILALDLDNVAQWARSEGIIFSSSSDLLHHPRTLELVRQGVDDANRRLEQGERGHRISTFRVLPGELEAGDELTPTGTLKRRRIASKYADIVAALQQPATTQAAS